MLTRKFIFSPIFHYFDTIIWENVIRVLENLQPDRLKNEWVVMFIVNLILFEVCWPTSSFSPSVFIILTQKNVKMLFEY